MHVTVNYAKTLGAVILQVCSTVLVTSISFKTRTININAYDIAETISINSSNDILHLRHLITSSLSISNADICAALGR